MNLFRLHYETKVEWHGWDPKLPWVLISGLVVEFNGIPRLTQTTQTHDTPLPPFLSLCGDGGEGAAREDGHQHQSHFSHATDHSGNIPSTDGNVFSHWH